MYSLFLYVLTRIFRLQTVVSSAHTSPLQNDFEVDVINTRNKGKARFTEELDDYEEDTTDGKQIIIILFL